MPDRFKTKTETVYNFIKVNILKGKFKPEQKITTREISEKLAISDIPIREAIKQLETEGFLTSIPHVGASVVKLREIEFEEIAMVRGELEGLATRLAARFLTEKDFKALERIFSEADQAVQSKQYATLAEINKRFHFAIYSCLPYKMLIKMISDLWDKSLMLPNIFVHSIARCRQSQKDHKQIIEALRMGKVKRAERIIVKQKIDALKHLTKCIQKGIIKAEAIEVQASEKGQKE